MAFLAQRPDGHTHAGAPLTFVKIRTISKQPGILESWVQAVCAKLLEEHLHMFKDRAVNEERTFRTLFIAEAAAAKMAELGQVVLRDSWSDRVLLLGTRCYGPRLDLCPR